MSVSQSRIEHVPLSDDPRAELVNAEWVDVCTEPQ